MIVTPRRIKAGAFTLVELLVVVGVLSILAGVLLPVYARARENARSAACASNLRQLGQAMLQYTRDYDEPTPVPRCGMGQAVGTDSLCTQECLFPYVKDTRVYRCPSRPFLGGPNVCYWDNMDLDGLPLAAVSRPAEKVMFGESDGYGYAAWRAASDPHRWHFAGRVQEPHLGGLNVCFYDGHLRWMTKASLDDRRRWHHDHDS